MLSSSTLRNPLIIIYTSPQHQRATSPFSVTFIHTNANFSSCHRRACREADPEMICSSQDVHEGRLLRSASMEVKRKKQEWVKGEVEWWSRPWPSSVDPMESYIWRPALSAVGWDWTFGHQNENASVDRWESKHSGFLQLRPSPKWADRESHLPAVLLPAQGVSSLLSGHPSICMDIQRKVDTVQHSFNSKILISDNCLLIDPILSKSPLWAVLHYTVNWCYKVW